MSYGLVQRVTALNLFLADIYSKKQIIADGVVPEDFVFSSSGYLAQVEGIMPPHGIYSHISGIDLVQAKDDSWLILEDNLRIPSGASYPLIARGLERKCSPQTFVNNHVVDNRNYGPLFSFALCSCFKGLSDSRLQKSCRCARNPACDFKGHFWKHVLSGAH